MDPSVAWSIVHNDKVPTAESVQAAEDLLDWLEKGGFPPTQCADITYVLGYCRGFVQAYKRDRALA